MIRQPGTYSSGVFGAPDIGELRYAVLNDRWLVFYRVEDVREVTDKEAQALMKIFGGAKQTIMSPMAPRTRPAAELPESLIGKRKITLDPKHRKPAGKGKKEENS